MNTLKWVVQHIRVATDMFAPIGLVITAIQGGDSTLADACRYWLFMAKGIKQSLPLVPNGECTLRCVRNDCHLRSAYSLSSKA